jgi:hypothetical protein
MPPRFNCGAWHPWCLRRIKDDFSCFVLLNNRTQTKPMIYEGSCQRLDSWHRTEEHERSLLHNNGICGARAPYIRVELVSHETVAIRIVGGIEIGVV